LDTSGPNDDINSSKKLAIVDLPFLILDIVGEGNVMLKIYIPLPVRAAKSRLAYIAERHATM
jgi:hypothetical protein